jgi:hypothetical protein
MYQVSEWRDETARVTCGGENGNDWSFRAFRLQAFLGESFGEQTSSTVDCMHALLPSNLGTFSTVIGIHKKHVVRIMLKMPIINLGHGQRAVERRLCVCRRGGTMRVSKCRGDGHSEYRLVELYALVVAVDCCFYRTRRWRGSLYHSSSV